MLTQCLMALFCLDSPAIQPVKRMPLPQDIYVVESLASTGDGGFVVLDNKSYLIVRIRPDGTFVKTGKRGPGPGEFFIPRSITSANGKVYVTDFKKIKVYDDKNLDFIRNIEVEGNGIAINCYGDEIFLAMPRYPANEFGMHVLGTDGSLRRLLYEHGVDDAPDEMKMPHFDQGSDGSLYLLHRQHYRVDILDQEGERIRPFKPHITPRYRPVTSLAKVEQKYGVNMASWRRWHSQWSASSRIAIVEDRFLWVCFEELQEDMRTRKFFVDVYDLDHDNRKLISWREMPGRLGDGGDAAHFVEDVANSELDYDLEIVGYKVSP